MSGKLGMDVIAHYLHRLAGAKVGQQGLQLVVVQQLLIEQLGQTGPDRRLLPLNAHPQAGFALDAEPEVAELLTDFRHIPLQCRPAQIPGISQLIELDPLLCRQ